MELIAQRNLPSQNLLRPNIKNCFVISVFSIPLKWPCNFTNHSYVPELVCGELAQLIKLDLLREDIEWDVDGPPQPTAALVVVEDGVEAGAVPVEEVLVPQRIEVPDAAGGITEERVRELVQRAELSFEPQTTHLHKKQTVETPGEKLNVYKYVI